MIEPTTSINIEEFHYENSYKRLCQSETGKSKKELAFQYMWELFVWSTIIGFRTGSNKKIEKRYPTPPFRWQVIKEPHQKLLLALAVEHHGSFNILQDGELLRSTLEEHSNGGLDIIHKDLALDPLAYQNTESLIYEIKKNL